MKILVAVGTRPEAIKMAPVVRALIAKKDCFSEVKLCLTAQHRDLLDQVIRTFALQVDYDLDLMAPGQSLYDITSRVLLDFGAVLQDAKPDVVLVHGDTTTSFAASLAAYYEQIAVGHVEAGLRTYDKYKPFPEEMNRRLVDACCDYHYAPTEGAQENLLAEGLSPDHILVTGNTVIDALLYAADAPYEFSDPLLAQAGRDRKLILVTAHRRESFGEPFREMCQAMVDLAAKNPAIEIIYPVHPNPNVRSVTQELLKGRERIHCIDPLDYLPFVHLLKKAHIVLTDSGGIQEEAPSLGKPVLVMRETTERPEAVAAGVARLVGNRYEGIRQRVQELLDEESVYSAMTNAINPYGDGQAAVRIADHLAKLA